MTETILETSAVTKRFGGLVAVNDVSFAIPKGAIVSIIGPNGAGKTTFFNMLTGLYKPTVGRIEFAGRDVTAMRPDKIMALGVARTFQNIRLFGTMSAVENVMVGQHARMKAGLFGSILRPPGVRKEEKSVEAKAREMLGYVGLKKDTFDWMATNLAYGDQRRVEIARALASEPQLLLLDEPTAGVDPKARRDFWEEIHTYAAEGLTFLIATHYMDEAERCHRLAFISGGKLLTYGTVDEVVSHARLTTWEATGPQLHALAEKLRRTPGIEQAVAFGTSLHVSAGDEHAIEQAIEPFRTPEHQWRKVDSKLEDVFIHLMNQREETTA
jgi:ABC-type branched-subunit amino acid transport system ATPase component